MNREERITLNEKRLDSIKESVNNLDKALEEFNKNKKNIELLKKYYGSKNWFADKKAYEDNKIPKIKAGVLSEDAVWNTLEDIDDLIKKMNRVVETDKQ